jgi:large subunit ribosomal protein LP0
MNGFKNLVSIALGTAYSFKEAEQMKDMIEHPEKFAAAAPAAAAPAAKEEKKEEEKKEEPKEEEEEEEGDFGLDLFA